MTRVGWIGTGAMGGRMAARLLQAGCEVAVWNRTPARARRLAEAGARVAPSPAAAARGAEMVFTMVTGPDALRAVTEGPSGVAAGVSPGTTVVEASTAGTAAVARLRQRLPEPVGLLDAPVLGSVAEAEAGTLTLLVGGPDEHVERALPLLRLLGTPLHVGPGGAGAAAKLVANSALLSCVAALGECVALADSLGLARDTAWRVLGLTPLGAQAERRRPMVESGAYSPRFALAAARKDADLIVTEAGDRGTGLRLATAVREWLAAAEQAGLGAADYTAVLGHILASAGPGGDDGPA